MINQEFDTVDDLAREVVRLGREVAEQARQLHVGGNSKDAAFVSRALEFLRERKPFAETCKGGLETVQDILNKDIRVEIVGSEEVFVPTHFDEFGQHGDRCEQPVYSARGKKLLELRAQLLNFIESREVVLDHAAAHRALLRVMSA